MQLEEIEDALHDSFDHDHLAIYADELQRRGDPRGELIALDLRADERGGDVNETGELVGELAVRRRELIRELLGPIASVHPLVRCRFGFVDLMFALRDEMRSGSLQAFDAALSGPLGRYVRDVTLNGDGMRLRDLMISLGKQPRPFLTRLALQGPHQFHYVDLAREVAERAVEMMPRLERLEANGRRCIPAVRFPTVRSVTTHCYDAIIPLCKSEGQEPCFPNVIEANIRLGWTLQAHQLESLLPPHELPKLRDLDVSRCIEPVGDAGGYDVFRYLRIMAIAPQIERLRVPALERLDQANNLQATIDRMPDLVEVAIAGAGYYPLRAEPLRHPSATVRAVAV